MKSIGLVSACCDNRWSKFARFMSYEKLAAFFDAKKDELAYLRPEIVREKLAEQCRSF
jgi:hypothetical protein